MARAARAAGPCVFCAVVRGTAEAHAVADTADCIAILDVRPVFKGHVLVLPRAHVETLPALTPDALAALFALVQRVARVLPAALGADGTFVGVNNVVSQSVPHVHVHVVPRRRGDGLRGFFWPRQRYDPGEADAHAAKIRAALAAD